QRFSSPPRFVETLVVADESMSRFHGEGLRPYLLTVLAAAARSLRHRSLGTALELRVTRVLVLGQGTPGPPVTPNATETLRNFCRWQAGLNVPDEDSPRHFDTAVLFTRQDLCGASTCATLGMADVGTVCDPERSCAVVEDDGLQAAFTVTHELGEPREGRGGTPGLPPAAADPRPDPFTGHLLNIPHDTSQPCRALNGGSGGSRRVMAPVLSALEPGQVWSRCSARFVTEFLENGHGRAWRGEGPDAGVSRGAAGPCPRG
ncbi:ATS4 metalloproteinase, partial [Sapayoa aenigma]|nr:ATS4 metalloproteinase [Sapayoa aenigma]